MYGFTPVVTLLGFGRWDAVLAEPPPAEGLLIDQAVFHYARGVALANKHDLAGARSERAKVQAIENGDLSRYDAANVPAKAIIGLALALLDGDIERNAGDLRAAVGSFEIASDLERKLPIPNRRGGISRSAMCWARPCSRRDAGQAEAVYRESLKTYRDDGWALYSLAQALTAQGKTAEAAEVRKQFRDAWRMADVRLTASRF